MINGGSSQDIFNPDDNYPISQFVPQNIYNRIQGDKYTCGDGKEIPSLYLNDNFCDCKDGSDEYLTSACASGVFYCHDYTKKSNYTPISASRINDGICDCCDGSDENNGICPDSCENMYENYTIKQQELNEIYLKAQKIKLNMRKVSVKNWKRRGRDLKEYNEKYNMAIRGLGGYTQAESNDFFFVHAAMREVIHMDLGYKKQYYFYLHECYRTPIYSELELLGGSPNSLYKYYQYYVCPFKLITQRVINITQWKYDTDMLLHHRTQVKVKEKDDYEESSIGAFTSFSEGIFRHESYERCFTGDKKQSTIFTKCGLKTRIYNAKENGRCNFEFTMDTPFACPEVELID